MRAPLFWKETNLLSTALLPLAALYGRAAAYRQKSTTPLKLPVSVICVGNLVAGGAGKTPVALAIGALLKARGINAHYLSRGFGGSFKGPVRVDPATHKASEVGDEPLLLAQMLPTWVAKDKIAGAKAAIAAGAQMIVMDDGLQNPLLHKDVSLLVMDGRYGLGNERMMPAGPLRETIASAMARTSAIVLVGDDVHLVASRVHQDKPILQVRIVPTAAAKALAGKPVVAFAGIAHPRKFYRTLQEVGADIKKMVAYPDHYVFKPGDAAFLRARAKEYEAILVTTLKDYVRLPQDLRGQVTPVPIEAVFEDSNALLRLVIR